MPVRDVLWDNEIFDPSEPVWFLNGTAYDEDDHIVAVKYRVPDEKRLEIMTLGRVPGGIERYFWPLTQEDIIRSGL